MDYMTYLSLAEIIKMADGHQENAQNVHIPETNENASNDVEEVDEVCNIFFFLKKIGINPFLIQTVIQLSHSKMSLVKFH